MGILLVLVVMRAALGTALLAVTFGLACGAGGSVLAGKVLVGVHLPRDPVFVGAHAPTTGLRRHGDLLAALAPFQQGACLGFNRLGVGQHGLHERGTLLPVGEGMPG